MQKPQNSVYSWPAIERMMRIHRLIENKEYPNCSKIAHDFEMSVRTIKRDVDYRSRLSQEGTGSFNCTAWPFV